jgi:phosphoribosylformylglycinamidine cyclo-ligase
MYGEDFDLVGSITGVVEKENLINGENIKPGHIAVGMASNGLHTNGYSLARHIIFDKCRYDVHTELKELGTTIGDALLKPHTCYWGAVEKVMQSTVSLDGMAHITGGGLYDNVPRILPKTVNVEFDSSALPVPPIMKLINDAGNIAKSEAYRVFNMGIGMVLFVPESDADKTVELCRDAGYETEICGKVSAGDGTVIVD